MVERCEAANLSIRPCRQPHQFLQELTHRGHARVLLGTAYLEEAASQVVFVQPLRIGGGQAGEQRRFDHADAHFTCQVRSMTTGFRSESNAAVGGTVGRAVDMPTRHLTSTPVWSRRASGASRTV